MQSNGRENIAMFPTGDKKIQMWSKKNMSTSNTKHSIHFFSSFFQIILTINELRKLKHALDQMGLHSVTHNIPEPT